MKIYTKKGDEGQTSLVDGKKINKSHIRLETYGTCDELNSHLGLLVGLLDPLAEFEPVKQALQEVQVWLFQLGSQLACSDPEMAKKLPSITPENISALEAQMDSWDEELPALKNFILPGGHPAAGQTHVCRTVSRRAERACVQLNESETLGYPAIAFLNRLSDYFFVLSRVINHRMSIESPEWKP